MSKLETRRFTSAAFPPQEGAFSLRKFLISKPYYRWYVPYLFLLPGLTMYLLWILYPLLYQFHISLHEWSIMPNRPSEFIGMQNYVDVVNNDIFWLSLRNTAMYAFVTVVGQLVIGLVLAILVHRVAIGKKFFRAIFYLPVVTSWLVVSLLFLFLFASEEGGLVNHVLLSLGIIEEPVSWISTPGSAWIVIYMLGIWKGVGWAMVIFLAALQGIPVEQYEAAAVDGANGRQQFQFVTLPTIRQTAIFIAVALTIGGFNVFPSVYFITGGGPLNRTEVILGHMYKVAFRDLNFGYGAAAAYILALIIIVISFAQLKFFSKPQES
jgi:multiple sugar transport system permease protein